MTAYGSPSYRLKLYLQNSKQISYFTHLQSLNFLNFLKLKTFSIK